MTSSNFESRGITPSVVEETILNGEIVNIDQINGTVEYYDRINKLRVILNEQEEVVTVIGVSKE